MLICAACFGLDFSWGGGISYSPFTSKIIVSDPGLEGVATGHLDFAAACAYVDFPYIRTSFSFASLIGATGESKETFLSISVLLKYVFSLGGVLMFPLVGVENDINLSYTDADGDDLKPILSEYALDHLNRSFFKAGFGVGFPLGKSLCISSIAMFGFKLNSIVDLDFVELFKSTYGLFDVVARSSVFELSLLIGSKPKTVKVIRGQDSD